MTVRELFLNEKIDKDWLITNMTGISSYYENTYSFLMENWDRDIEALSPKQGAWLTNILDDAVEKRIEG